MAIVAISELVPSKNEMLRSIFGESIRAYDSSHRHNMRANFLILPDNGIIIVKTRINEIALRIIGALVFLFNLTVFKQPSFVVFKLHPQFYSYIQSLRVVYRTRSQKVCGHAQRLLLFGRTLKPAEMPGPQFHTLLFQS